MKLTNLCINTPTKELNIRVQKFLFKHGYVWMSEDINIQNENGKSLYTEGSDDMTLSYTNKPAISYVSYDKIIEAIDLLKQTNFLQNFK